MKTVMVYGGNTWRECVEMAQEISQHMLKERIYSMRLFSTNAEIITDNVRVLVRPNDEKYWKGRVIDECFGFDPRTTALIKRTGYEASNPGKLMDYILREEGR